MARNKEPYAFRHKWPEGLKDGEVYRIKCDDDGRLCDSTFTVLVAEDGDVHLGMWSYHDRERTGANLNPFPHVRVRTRIGGGRNWRTRQALPWLADAIRRDNEENGVGDE